MLRLQVNGDGGVRTRSSSLQGRRSASRASSPRSGAGSPRCRRDPRREPRPRGDGRPDDEAAAAVAGEAHRWSVAAVLEPLSVELHLSGAQALPAALAHPNVGEENPRRRPVPVLTHGSSFPSLSAEVRTGGVEPPQHEATGLQPAELTDAQRPQSGVADRARTGASGLTLPDAAATPRPPRSGDDRSRTGNLSPDKRVISQLSYVPAAPRLDSSAGRRQRPAHPLAYGPFGATASRRLVQQSGRLVVSARRGGRRGERLARVGFEPTVSSS